MSRRIWKPEELEYLIQTYQDTSSNEIARHLNRSVRSVYSMANLMGLKKTNEYLLEQQKTSMAKANEKGLAYRFAKGHTPSNKGTKGLTGANSGSFKKGDVPRNYKPPGTKRIDVEGYLMVKVKDPNKWKYVHRLNYQEAFGAIPKGHVVSFRDGNKLNCDPSNLILLSQQDNMIRNSIQRFPEELKKTIKVLTKLKKTINNYGKKQD